MAVKRDAGNATVEFIAISVALMLPIAYAVVALAQVEAAVYGVNGAAQMAARAYLNSSSDLKGRYAAARSAAIAGRNHGLFIDASQVLIHCPEADCLQPGMHARVTVDTQARITVPPFTRVIPVHAERAFTVDPYRQVPA